MTTLITYQSEQLYQTINMRLGKQALKEIGLNVLSISDCDYSNVRLKAMYKSNFGCSLSTVYQIWNMLDQNNPIPVNGNATHLSWCLAYLKTYKIFLNYCTKYRVSEKTFCKCVTCFVIAILKIVIAFFIKFKCFFKIVL
jgi:hypothetical protein